MPPAATELQPVLEGYPLPRYVGGPSPYFLTGEETLRLQSLANVGSLTLTVTGRVLRPDNTIARIQFTHTPNSNRTIASTLSALSSGWLLGLTVRATTGAPSAGSVWVNLELVIGLSGATQVVQSLGCGFLTANTPYVWPSGVNYLPTDGPGQLRVIVGTNPAAGSEVSETVPTGARWQVLSFSVILVTSATVASRVPSLALDDGTNQFWQSTSGNAQTAGTTFTWEASTAPLASGAAATIQIWPIPSVTVLPAGGRLRTVTASIQAGDDYAAPIYVVREWITGE